nr:hypothetical protein [Tanacetum cinerariifolium]
MTSFNQRECVGCGRPCDGFYCYLCTCQQCGINLINGICLNCTYGDGKSVTCCECEGPLNGEFCSFCASRAGNSFAYDPYSNSFDDSQNLSDYPPQPQYQTEYLENPSNAITLVLPTKEPDNSLSMGDEHLSTIPKTKSDKVIKSSVENLVPIPSESEGISDDTCDEPDNSLSVGDEHLDTIPVTRSDEFIKSSVEDLILIPSESEEVDALLSVEDKPTSSQFLKSYLDPEGDMLLFEAFLSDDHSSDFKTKSSSTSLNSLLEETNNFNNYLPEFTTFLKVLFDAECESDSSDDQSCFDEDVLVKIVSKPLCEEEIIPMKSLRTHDSSLLISSKIYSLLDEFAGELTLLKSISSRIDETDCDFEEYIVLSINCCTITLFCVHRKNLFLQILMLPVNLS